MNQLSVFSACTLWDVSPIIVVKPLSCDVACIPTAEKVTEFLMYHVMFHSLGNK